MPNQKLEEIVDVILPMIREYRTMFPSRQFEILLNPKDWEEIFEFQIEGIPVRMDVYAPHGEPKLRARPVDGPS